ncbi:enterin neuropeptides [Plakobranchus ocellatus]|uniref:Enterin neuropeptides n=1 Tax=Plakobranchus ocellatus TaxID=259542 RepID=A0AAV4DUF1_9GAST|nr:enterin neuropeptides [Plakobranchus ocellatus]
MAAPRTKRSDTLRLDDKQYIRLPFQRRVSNKFVHNFVGKRGDATPEFSSKLAELERSAAARQAMEELAVRRLLLSQNSGNNDLGVAESVVLADIIGRRLQELAQTADEQGLQSIPLSLEARAHPGYSHAFVGKRENDQGSFGGLAAQPASWKTFGDEFSRVDLIPADALLLDSDGEAGPDDGVRFLNNPSVTDDNKFVLLSNGEGSFLNKRSIPIYDFDTLNSELGGSIRKLDKSFARRSQSKFGHAFVGKRGPGFNHAFVGKRQSYGHSFVGKRQTYGHSFVGKRQTYGHSFIGKRQVFGHSFVGKRQKFGHSFIGKRNNKETSRVKRSSAATSSDEDKRDSVTRLWARGIQGSAMRLWAKGIQDLAMLLLAKGIQGLAMRLWAKGIQGSAMHL